MSRRRWAWGIGALVALALLVLLASSRTSRWAEPFEAPSPDRSGRARRAAAGTVGPKAAGAPGRVLLLDAGTRPSLAADAGRAVATGSKRLRGHLLIDPCEEPLPEGEVPPPDDRALVSAGAARVAYSSDWLDRREARQLAAAVDAALDEAAQLLGAAPRSDVLVVTWPTREAMTDALDTAAWAQAMYDGAIHVTADAQDSSIRHEVMHAQLHAVAPCVPYWLDEGLAAYFEGDPSTRAPSWLRMIHVPMWIPFASLAEPLRDDEGTEAMAPNEVALLYAQSLAMTTMLVEEGGPDALERALAASNAGTSRRDLWQRAVPDVDGPQLVDFLARRLFPDLDADARARLAGEGYRCLPAEPRGWPHCVLQRR